MAQFPLRQRFQKIFSKNLDIIFEGNYTHEMFIDDFVYLINQLIKHSIEYFNL